MIFVSRVMSIDRVVYMVISMDTTSVVMMWNPVAVGLDRVSTAATVTAWPANPSQGRL
jgi:hypothetical protein